MSSSAQHHSTFCTFDELARPQIFSIASILPRVRYGAPDFWRAQPTLGPIPVYSRSRFLVCRDRIRMKRLAMSLLVLALAPAPSGASQQGIVVMKNWKTMDQCTREAQTAFPDYTADANAKRAAHERECLAKRNLPPHETPAPGR